MLEEKNKIPLLDIRGTGTVREIKKGIVKVTGLSSCINGQLVELGSNLLNSDRFH